MGNRMKVISNDRRMTDRIPYSDKVSFRVFPRAGCPDGCRRESTGKTQDLSDNGACLVTDIELPKGAELQVRVTVSNPPAIFTIRGFVAWSRILEHDGRWRAGIEFKWTSEVHRREWGSMMRNLRERGMQREAAA